jgi:hypothetical protein
VFGGWRIVWLSKAWKRLGGRLFSLADRGVGDGQGRGLWLTDIKSGEGGLAAQSVDVIAPRHSFRGHIVVCGSGAVVGRRGCC